MRDDSPFAPPPREARQEELEDQDLELAEDRSDEECAPRCEFLTGPAGTGKTFEIKRRIAEDPSYGILCATTGIAAVNLNSVTLNSVLKYFDTESLEDRFTSGVLVHILHGLAKIYRNLVIDEVSMLSGQQLDYIHEAMTDVNGYATVKKPMGIVLTGDFCQLPPIKSPWAFTADCWPEFEKNTVKLDHFWRHPDPRFLEAINCVRRGDGPSGARLLAGMVEFAERADTHYDGTTIYGKNVEVDRYNFVAHNRLSGVPTTVDSRRWGKHRSEWKHIPNKLTLKEGAYVMILSNDVPEFTYVNGDCGHIVEYDEEDLVFRVNLIRTGTTVSIPTIERFYATREKPTASEMANASPTPKYDGKMRRWIWGGIEYFPLRLAYAATVHKTQGLSLDRVQIDCRGGFFGQPGMAYVALSRCRTPEGVRIIGTPELFGKRVRVAPEVLRWL